MNIGKSIIKHLILVLEGCVCRLKEWYPDSSETNDNLVSIVKDTRTRNVEQSNSDEYFNISLLDSYFNENGLSTDSGIIRLIQKIELNTEFSLINLLFENFKATDNIVSLFEKNNRQNLIEFKHYSPSLLRINEERVVVKSIVDEELIECGIGINTLDFTLYDKVVLLIELKQMNVVNDLFERFDTNVERVRQCLTDEELAAHKKVLFKALSDRKEIVDLKIRNFR